MTTLTIMRYLPREVDPLVYNMSHGENPGCVTYAEIGGLAEQIRELREVSSYLFLNFLKVKLYLRLSCFFYYKLDYNRIFFTLLRF